ncbi:MAG: carbohydrate ABC transporter permease, partial [Clostridiales bacterium]|nr:carbohydrate ABC transporter permease [Clostridiales bacterium]
MKKRKASLSKILIHLALGGFCAFCLLPMLMVISISFTPESVIRVNGYSLIPSKLSLEAYKYIFLKPMQIVRAYGVTITTTVCGVAIGLWCTSTLAYAISRADYAYRNMTMRFVFFTMLFSGGLTATYMLVARGLHMKDTLFALILPSAMQGWYVLLMRGFFSSLPSSVIESAKIDGASELQTFTKVVLPISVPGMATVGLFLALGYWNDWYASLLYIDNPNLVSLQFLLYKTMSNIEFLKSIASQIAGLKIDVMSLPSLSARMAMCVVAAGPMLVAFVFLQKYFIKGITVGS